MYSEQDIDNLKKVLNECMQSGVDKLWEAGMLSVEKREEQQQDWTAEFTGAWKDDRSTKEIISAIRGSRNGNRDIDLW